MKYYITSIKAIKQTLLILFFLILTVHVFASDTIDYVGYKELYENQKEYNQSIIGTVFQVLIGMGGLVLVVLGSQFVFNYNINQRKYINLKDRLQNDIKELVTMSVEVNNSKFEQTYINTYKSINQSYKDAVDTFKESFQKQLEDSDKKLNEKFSKIEIDLRNVKIDNFLTKGLLYERSEQYNSALNTYADFATYCIETKKYNVRALMRINRVLSKMKSISKESKETVDELINQFPTSELYNKYKKFITEWLEEIQIEEIKG